MKKIGMIIMVTLFTFQQVNAQCDHEAEVILIGTKTCSTDTIPERLSTQVYDSYQWYVDGVPLLSEVGQFLETAGLGNSPVDVTVSTTLDGCMEMSKVFVYERDESPNGAVYGTHYHGPFPYSEYLNHSDTTFICQSALYDLAAQMPFDTLFEWYRNGELLSDEDSSIYTAWSNELENEIDEYSYTGRLKSCPNDTHELSTIYLRTLPCFSGSNDIQNLEIIGTYPNPSQGLIRIELPDGSKDRVSFELMDAQGIHHEAGKILNGTGSIDMTDLPVGIYFLHIQGYPVPKRIVKN